jgi:hypothetical protein
MGGGISINTNVTKIQMEMNTITLDSKQTMSENEYFFLFWSECQ